MVKKYNKNIPIIVSKLSKFCNFWTSSCMGAVKGWWALSRIDESVSDLTNRGKSIIQANEKVFWDRRLRISARRFRVYPKVDKSE